MADKNAVPVSTGAEAFLEQVRALGVVRYLFANTGTDHGPIIEALARSAKEDPRDIQPIVVPHELAAVSMAHGYYNVTHKPQMVLVHTLPGTANALGGIINAHSCNVPLFLVAGRTPITEGELRGGKSQNIHWRQESRDQGNLVREFVKWDYEVRTNQNLAAVVSRAYKIAMSEPRGPVYLTLPREWLCQALESTQLLSESLAPATKMQADQASLEQTAELAHRCREPAHRYEVSRSESRSGGAPGGACRIAFHSSGTAVQSRQFPHGSSALRRLPDSQACSERRCLVLHRYRCAVGAAEP